MSHSYPFVSVDVVAVTLKEGRLHILTHERTNRHEPAYGEWTLVGGFVHANEDADLESAAVRILSQKAGPAPRYLEQLQTFGGSTRDSRGWSVSVVYLAIVEEGGALLSNARWEPLEEIMKRPLPFDHSLILMSASERLRSKSSYSSLPLYFLPPSFTLGQMQKVYENILGTTLRAPAFRRKVIEMELVVQESDEPVKNNQRGRPSLLYTAKTPLEERRVTHFQRSTLA